MVAEIAALLAGAATILLALMVGWAARAQGAPVGPLLLVLMLAGLAAALLVLDPPEHVRSWLRRTADGVEAVAVAASIPLAIGVFGVYGELLRVFRG